MKLSECETIIDEKKFIEAHTATIERNKDNPYFEAYSERLTKYNEIKSKGNTAD